MITFRYLALVLLLSMFIFSCNDEHSRYNKISDFFDSNHYYMDKTVDSTRLLLFKNKLSRFYFVNGEEGFLLNKNYGFYIQFSQSKRDSNLTYVLKSFQGIGMVMKKRTKFDSIAIFYQDSSRKIAESNYIVNSISKTVPIDSLLAFKKILDAAIQSTHSYNPIAINDHPTEVCYFNGTDYYVISLDYTDYNTMRTVDSVFLGSTLLSEL